MKKNKLGFLALSSLFVLAACSSGGSTTTSSSSTASSSAATSSSATAAEDFTIVMITDTGGVDDASFNQGAWEAFQAWGQEHGKERGSEGYNYIHSKTDADFVTNYNTAIGQEYDLIFGIGYKLEDTTKQLADQNPEQHFVIVDSVVDKPNVASLTFADNEAAFLAGVAAANATQTKRVGFIGGIESAVITRFESGFKAGVASVDKSIVVETQFVGDFSDAAKGGNIASALYASGVDVIYHASGGAGKGVFTTAINLIKSNPQQPIWVIGVDLDQEAEGKYTDASGAEKSVTLTSTLKGVGEAVKQFANDTMTNGFKAGVKTYSLKDNGVGLTDGQLSEETKAKVQEFRTKIESGELKVPSTKEELEAFLKELQ